MIKALLSISANSFFHENIDTAMVVPGFDIPPYKVESFAGYDEAGWHCVSNKHGFNCLRFSDARGAKFTSIVDAHKICEAWNTQQNRMK